MANSRRDPIELASCEELKDALAAQQELLRQQIEGKGAVVGGATVGGEMLPGSTKAPEMNTAIEFEIERIEALLQQKGCQ